jgi:hypothetical protein
MTYHEVKMLQNQNTFIIFDVEPIISYISENMHKVIR